MSDFDIDIVRDFILSRGGKIKNNDLVSHFKTFLNDPRNKDSNRAKFKSIVNTIAIVKLDTTGEKVLVLKKKYRDDGPSERVQQQTETPKKHAAPKAKLKEAFVPRTPSEDTSGAETDERPSLSDVTGADSSLLAAIQRELHTAGLEDESHTDDPTEHADDSQTSDVFVDAESHLSSPTDSVYEDTSPTSHIELSSPEHEITSEKLETVQLDQEDDNTDTFEFKVPFGEPPRLSKEPSLSSVEATDGTEESQPLREPSPVMVQETATSSQAEAVAEQTQTVSMDSDSGKSPASHSTTSSAEPATEQQLEGPSLQTPARANSKESLGPKEPPISVKDRAKHLNKISSEVDLHAVQTAPDKLLRRGDGREGSEESDIISLNQTEREWMIHAAKSDYQPLFKLLNKNPYLAKRKDFTCGYTALHWACKHGNTDVVKLLCGTDDVEVNAKSNGGYTPLHLAAMQGHEEIIEILVAVYGADTNLRDYNGKKAKQYLKNSASSRSQQLLQARRHSMVQGSGGTNSTFKRQGSYSAKIRSAGHFGIQASTAVRTSWVASGSQSRSTSSSPRSSPSSSRRSSVRDDELMPPPQGVPARRRRNKKGSANEQLQKHRELEKTESEPCLSNRASSVPPHASDQDLTRAGSDPTIGSQAATQSVSHTSMV